MSHLKAEIPKWLNTECASETIMVYKAIYPSKPVLADDYKNYTDEIRHALKQQPDIHNEKLAENSKIHISIVSKRNDIIKHWLKPVNPEDKEQIQHLLKYLEKRKKIPAKLNGRRKDYNLLLDVVWLWSTDNGNNKDISIKMHSAWRAKKSRNKINGKAITISNNTKKKIKTIIVRYRSLTGEPLSEREAVRVAVDAYVEKWRTDVVIFGLKRRIDQQKEKAFNEVVAFYEEETKYTKRFIEFLFEDDEINNYLPLGILKKKVDEFHQTLRIEMESLAKKTNLTNDDEFTEGNEPFEDNKLLDDNGRDEEDERHEDDELTRENNQPD